MISQEKELEALKTQITQGTTMPLKMVATLMVFTAVVVAGYVDIKYALGDLYKEIAQMRVEVKEKMNDRWTKDDDLWFMYELCDTNQLKCPPHVRMGKGNVDDR